MIANVSPSVTTFDDTYNTLKYANRAKNIKTQLQRNVMNVQYHISNYNQIIGNLKNEIAELKNQLAKRDFTLNNILPVNSVNDSKKELSKEEIKQNNDSHNEHINNSYFEKAVAELKIHFAQELSIKQNIIDIELEISNINSLINRRRNELQDDKNYNLSAESKNI